MGMLTLLLSMLMVEVTTMVREMIVRAMMMMRMAVMVQR